MALRLFVPDSDSAFQSRSALPRRPPARRRSTARAAAACCAIVAVASAHAQTGSVVTVSGRSIADAAVAGFGDIPLSRAPLSAQIFRPQQIADQGIRSIGDLTRVDASLTDAYDAPGYWSIVASRGYTLDNRFNYRRDGLPINAETSIALENKDRVELLKGISGIQAGTSAPGGIVNLVVARPEGTTRSATLGLRDRGTLHASADIGQRFGTDGAFGVRGIVAAERLRPEFDHAEGRRTLVSLAADWRLAPDTLLQAEVESSRQRQPSVAGFSLLGDAVPDADRIDPRVNLNRQPWGRPVEFDGDTASLRWQQKLPADWRLTVHAMRQRLNTDDRTAFPYGVYDANYDCPRWCDRYAPDGTFSYWQYVSDGERRTSDALQASVAGRAKTGAVEHSVEAGVLGTRYRGRFNDQIYDLARDPSGNGDVGYGNVFDPGRDTLPSFGSTDANTDRDERSTEFFVRDAMSIDRWQLWAGVRHTRIDRASRRTSPASDGFRATSYAQNETLPWLALSRDVGEGTVVYASWGQGLETDVAPSRERFINAGQALPALKSRQTEVGIKHAGADIEASLAVFDIDRPKAADIGICDSTPDSCVRAIDGSARHRGVEAQGSWRTGAWTWRAGAMLLDAERRGSAIASVNGTRPENVPTATLRLGGEVRPSALAGVALHADLVAESDRVAVPGDESVRIPGWSRIDLGARWRQTVGATSLIWRVGVDNVTDRRAWKEAPYQFGHVYLYPLSPRSWRASVQANF